MRPPPPLRPLPLACWPVVDHRRFATACEPGDILTPGGPLGHWRPVSIGWLTIQYGYWLAWLKDWALLDTVECPADRCTPDRLGDYLAFCLKHYAASTTVMRLDALAQTLAALCPDADLGFLRATKRRIHVAPNPDRRARLRTADELLDFGLALMTTADQSGDQHARRARQYRNGFIIAFLACRPLRRRNLANLHIGRHLNRVDGSWRIQIPGDETKTHRPIDEPLPDLLAPWLERYLQLYRPHLVPRAASSLPDSGALFMSSQSGQAMKGHSINLMVSALIRQHFGKSMSVHMFREAVPTTLAIKLPQHVRIAAVINNHADYRTTERWYNLARMMDAAQSHLDNLADLRKELG